MRGHGAAGQRDLAGSRWHRRGGRRGPCGRVRPPSSWPRRSECRSHKARGRRDGDTGRATRGLGGTGAGRDSERRGSRHCSAAEHDRHGGPRTLHPARHEHDPSSRATPSCAWQPCTADDWEVRGSWEGGQEMTRSSDPLRVMGSPKRDGARAAREAQGWRRRRRTHRGRGVRMRSVPPRAGGRTSCRSERKASR